MKGIDWSKVIFIVACICALALSGYVIGVLLSYL